VSWILIAFLILAAWAVVRILGGERQRQVQLLQSQILQQAAEAARTAG
jgi:flagellar biogenesis protein FliO